MRLWKAFPVCRAVPSASCPVSVNKWAQDRLCAWAVGTAGDNVTAASQASPDTRIWVHNCLWAELREVGLAKIHSWKLSGTDFQKTFGNHLPYVWPEKLSQHFSGIQLRWLLNPCRDCGQPQTRFLSCTFLGNTECDELWIGSATSGRKAAWEAPCAAQPHGTSPTLFSFRNTKALPRAPLLCFLLLTMVTVMARRMKGTHLCPGFG